MITDERDGQSYQTITIESQVWMAENLKTTKYNDGTDIPIDLNPSIWASIIHASKN